MSYATRRGSSIEVQSGIYTITNLVTRRVYVGSTRFFHGRKIAHLSGLNNGKHPNKLLQRDWNLFGSDCFEFEFIEKFDKTFPSNSMCGRSLLYEREQYHLEQHSKNYNPKSACAKYRLEWLNEQRRTGAIAA